MLVFRIAHEKYADALQASGRAARWNENDIAMIYTSGSRALCCLENVVHRSKLGLSANFRLMTIKIPDDMVMMHIDLKSLPADWTDFSGMYYTQNLGSRWVQSRETAVLKVPSSIVPDEYNYLINPLHEQFKRIKLLEVKPFLFDDRIKD